MKITNQKINNKMKQFYKLHLILLDDKKPISKNNFCKCEITELTNLIHHSINYWFTFQSFIEKINKENIIVISITKKDKKILNELKIKNICELN